MKTFYLKEAPGIRRQVSAKDRPETMKREQIFRSVAQDGLKPSKPEKPRLRAPRRVSSSGAAALAG
jgi:hypothetical protein